MSNDIFSLSFQLDVWLGKLTFRGRQHEFSGQVTLWATRFCVKACVQGLNIAPRECLGAVIFGLVCNEGNSHLRKGHVSSVVKLPLWQHERALKLLWRFLKSPIDFQWGSQKYSGLPSQVCVILQNVAKACACNIISWFNIICSCGLQISKCMNYIVIVFRQLITNGQPRIHLCPHQQFQKYYIYIYYISLCALMSYFPLGSCIFFDLPVMRIPLITWHNVGPRCKKNRHATWFISAQEMRKSYKCHLNTLLGWAQQPTASMCRLCCWHALTSSYQQCQWLN